MQYRSYSENTQYSLAKTLCKSGLEKQNFVFMV
jgi:hypothetical protein